MSFIYVIFPTVASRTRDLEAKQKKKQKKKLICKCLSSVHLQSIVEKGEIFIN